MKKLVVILILASMLLVSCAGSANINADADTTATTALSGDEATEAVTDEDIETSDTETDVDSESDSVESDDIVEPEDTAEPDDDNESEKFEFPPVPELREIVSYDLPGEGVEFINSLKALAEELEKKSNGADVGYIRACFADYPGVELVLYVGEDPHANRGERTFVESFICDGERYRFEPYECYPSFKPYVMDGYGCITVSMCCDNGGYFMHDGVCEWIGIDQITEELDDYSLYFMKKHDEDIVYMCFSKGFGDIIHSPVFEMVENFESADQPLYLYGKVVHENEELKLVTIEEYTIGEWYATATELQNISGCDNVEDFIKWLSEIDYAQRKEVTPLLEIHKHD